MSAVLPLTREWIEINIESLLSKEKQCSPSYEGVDWNWYRFINCYWFTVLPLTREWIEIYCIRQKIDVSAFSLLRGSGLKCVKRSNFGAVNRSPSYEGVDWNCFYRIIGKDETVLPLTREWIEISAVWSGLKLPKFSLLRGSGLKSRERNKWSVRCKVLPLTREWIEIFYLARLCYQELVLPLTREWIEIRSMRITRRMK